MKNIFAWIVAGFPVAVTAAAAGAFINLFGAPKGSWAGVIFVAVYGALIGISYLNVQFIHDETLKILDKEKIL